MATLQTDLTRLASQYGFTLKRSRSHCIWVHAITHKVVTTGKTPSDRRVLKNIERNFRHAAVPG